MAKGVVKAMATKSSYGQVKHVDDYLRGELEEQKAEGIEKTSNNLYDGLNCNRDNFTKTVMLHMKQYGEKEVKAYEYVQSFSPEDKANGLTPEKAHDLGMKYARKYFGQYPTLVVTHIDTDHIHNQILVGNVNVENGKSLQVSPQTLEQMKEFTGKQCEREGLTQSIWEHKREKPPWEQKKDCEYLMESQGKFTDKQQIAHIVRQEIPQSKDLEELKKRLQEKYNITVRTTKNSISFSHPDMKRPIRGEKLGEDLTKGAIENGIEFSKQRGNSELGNTLKSIAEYESRKESASQLQRGRTVENHGGYSKSGQPDKERRTSTERVGETTLSPTETVRSITKRVEKTTNEARNDFRNRIKELIGERGEVKSKLDGAEQKLTTIQSRRIKAEQGITKLNSERNKIPNQIRGINDKLTRKQSFTMER